MEEVIVKIKDHSGLVLPQYMTEGSAGFDLIARGLRKVYKGTKELDMSLFMYAIEQGYFMLRAGERALVGTNLFIELPKGKELQIRPRSGLALKRGITVLNAPGTIDSDYRDEICVILVNTTPHLARVNFGDAVAQGVVADYDRVKWKVVEELSKSQRFGGFGHTSFWKPIESGAVNQITSDVTLDDHEIIPGTYLVTGRHALVFPLNYSFVGTKPYDGRKINKLTISTDRIITNEYTK